MASFHLSLPVGSLEESGDFFTRLLGGTIEHRDPGGYVNIELLGVQLTLAETEEPLPELRGLHFGFNLDIQGFEAIAQRIAVEAPNAIVMQPTTIDAGTARERRKMFLRCPSGYPVEIKGYAKPKEISDE